MKRTGLFRLWHNNMDGERMLLGMEKCLNKPKSFDLRQTLDCGQCFRWNEAEGGAWEGVAFGKYLLIEQEEDSLCFHCSEKDFEELWREYFDMDEDYDNIRTSLSRMSPVLKEAAEFAPGIHILRQEPWEALCSFIISQNNNIPRIKGIVERLCELCGERLAGGRYAFPTAETVAGMTVEDLAPIRSGFRAKYIISAARAVAEKEIDIEGIESRSVDFGRGELMKICGVGPKVADCTLLYGFHKTECFPVDVWMKRAMAALLPRTDPAEFGSMAGMAQQYIFHYSRMHPELFKVEKT